MQDLIIYNHENRRLGTFPSHGFSFLFQGSGSHLLILYSIILNYNLPESVPRRFSFLTNYLPIAPRVSLNLYPFTSNINISTHDQHEVYHHRLGYLLHGVFSAGSSAEYFFSYCHVELKTDIFAVVMRAPTHAMNEYRAVFNSAPAFADLNHISPFNLAGFDPHHLPLSMGGIRGASNIGVMIM
jgi:hypothetical protein